MRGDQKVLQLDYKILIYHTYYLFFTYSPATSVHLILLFFSAVYALKIEFSVFTLKPCLDSDLQ